MLSIRSKSYTQLVVASITVFVLSGWNISHHAATETNVDITEQRIDLPVLNVPLNIGISKGDLHASISQTNKNPDPSILLFVTTQLSSQHLAFLETCWPLVSRNVDVVQRADVVYFVTQNVSDATESTLAIQQQERVMRAAFPKQHNITIHRYPNPGYQLGAILAMYEGMRHNWFDGYDWVVRVNPDVIIMKHANFFEMMEDTEVDGLFLDCQANRKRLECPEKRNCTMFEAIHTDFFAFRPRAMINASFAPIVQDDGEINAELTATHYFQNYIVQYGRDRWIFDAFPKFSKCRAGHGHSGAPILHYAKEQGVRHCVKQFRESK